MINYLPTNEMEGLRAYYYDKKIYIDKNIKGLTKISIIFHEFIHFLIDGITLFRGGCLEDYMQLGWDIIYILLLPRYKNKKRSINWIKNYYQGN